MRGTQGVAEDGDKTLNMTTKEFTAEEEEDRLSKAVKDGIKT